MQQTTTGPGALPHGGRALLAPVALLRGGLLLVAPWRIVLALTSGALLALSFPPADVGWLAWVALVPLLVALRDMRPGGGFLAGLIAGGAFFAVLLVYIRQFGALPWLALAISQGLFVALFGYMAALMWRCPCAWIRVPALAACWTAAELLRGHLGALQFTFGGLGYSQHRAIWVLQMAGLVGHYGLGFFMALLAAGLVEAVPRIDPRTRPATGGPLVILVCLLIFALIWGGIRAARVSATGDSPGIDVLLIQGNISVQKASPELIDTAARLYVERSREDGAGADLVVWPETAIPGRLNLYPAAYEWVQSVPRRLGCVLMVGAAEAGSGARTFNTLWAFDAEGDLIELYRKQQLVIFGEYLPWREHLTFLVNAYPFRPFDYSPGSRDVLIRVKGAKASPMICFESIFPHVSRRLVRKGAELLVVITSDAWVGRAPGELRQHSQCSTLRAVESGRWLIRAGGTGVTCIIDPAGRVVASIPMFEQASVRRLVWPRRAITPYDAVGDWPLVLVTSLLILAGLADMHAAGPPKEAQR